MASNVSTNNPPGAQLIPDEKVDLILDRAKLQLEETEVRKLVEMLEKVSREHLVPIFQCIQPADDRCCSPIERACVREGDVSEDSSRFAGNTVSSPTHISSLNRRSGSWEIPPSRPVAPLKFGRGYMGRTNPSQSKSYASTSQGISGK